MTDHVERQNFAWSSVPDLARDWLSEWQASESGPACEFIHAICDDAVPGVVDALVVLAEVAEREADEAGWVGAGPLEDLLSHSGHGLLVVEEVARAAKQRPAFRKALSFVILPQEVEARLVGLGVIQLRPARQSASIEKPPKPRG